MLRNLIKMMLVADDRLTSKDTSQAAIANLDKTQLVQTNIELFQNFLSRGFLLLNATLVLRPNLVRADAKAWQPFLLELLDFIASNRQNIQLIMFGNIAKILNSYTKSFKRVISEHPYNISFIKNPAVLDFFRPLSLLAKTPATIDFIPKLD